MANIFQIVFAVCASVLVTLYAIYAKHSGIPEIKTVLGGFVMRRFLGTWTLVIKSLGLGGITTPHGRIPKANENNSVLRLHLACGLVRRDP